MRAEPKCGNWIEHFPGNMKWSNAIQIVKGMAPWGAVSLEEVDRVAARMTARAKVIWIRCGSRNGRPWPTPSPQWLIRLPLRAGRSRPVTTTCGLVTTTIAPSA